MRNYKLFTIKEWIGLGAEHGQITENELNMNRKVFNWIRISDLDFTTWSIRSLALDIGYWIYSFLTLQLEFGFGVDENMRVRR